MSWHLDRPDLLTAAAPWEQLRSALRETSAEPFEVVGAGPSPWWEGPTERPSPEVWPLVGGEYDGRSYVLGDVIGPGGAADFVTALAAKLGAVVLGSTFEDTAA